MAGWDSGLTDVVRAASAAALDPSKWVTMLDALCTRFGATAAAIHTPRGAPGDRPLFVDVGLPKHTIPDYVEHWSTKDPWFAGAASKQICVRTGECGIGRELCEWDELKKLDYYHEYAAPTGVEGLLGMIVDDGVTASLAPLTVIGLYRRPGLDEFTYDDKRTFESIHAPLQLALRSHWSAVRNLLSAQTASDAFSLVPKPLFLLARDGEVLFANRDAEALLTKGDWIGVRSGKLKRLGQFDRDAWERMLKGAADGASHTVGLLSTLTDKPVLRATAHLIPVGQNITCRLTWPRGEVLLLLDEAGNAGEEFQMTSLARRYQLTNAETQLAIGLARGLRLSEFADRNNVSIHTVRAHLQHVFAKTGMRRQSDLVRLFATGIG